MTEAERVSRLIYTAATASHADWLGVADDLGSTRIWREVAASGGQIAAWQGTWPWTVPSTQAPPPARRHTLASQDVRRQIERLSTDIARLTAAIDSQLASFATSLNVLESADFRLLAPIPIVIEPDDDGYAASWFQIDASGYGLSPGEAIASLEREVIDMFRDLVTADERTLGPAPRRWRSVLLHAIEPTAPV